MTTLIQCCQNLHWVDLNVTSECIAASGAWILIEDAAFYRYEPCPNSFPPARRQRMQVRVVPPTARADGVESSSTGVNSASHVQEEVPSTECCPLLPSISSGAVSSGLAAVDNNKTPICQKQIQ